MNYKEKKKWSRTRRRRSGHVLGEEEVVTYQKEKKKWSRIRRRRTSSHVLIGQEEVVTY